MPPSTSPTTIYHLQMLEPAALRPKSAPDGFEVVRVRPPRPELNRRMYREVGGAWQWTDRLSWSDEDWRRYAERPALETWFGSLRGEEAGYFELEIERGGSVQIAYFGLLPPFIGRGFGGPLLTAAVRRAWEIPRTRRVWVHTCTNDHDHALENYQRRGFAVFRTESE